MSKCKGSTTYYAAYLVHVNLDFRFLSLKYISLCHYFALQRGKTFANIMRSWSRFRMNPGMQKLYCSKACIAPKENKNKQDQQTFKMIVGNQAKVIKINIALASLMCG